MIGAASVAGATDHGFYMGVDGGVASYPSDVHLTIRTGTTDTLYYNKKSRSSDFAWSFAAGYRFNRYLAAELGFSDLGHAKSDLLTKADPDTDPSKGSIEHSMRGKSLALLAHLPVGNWDSYLKVGVRQSIYGIKGALKYDKSELQLSSTFEDAQWLLGVGTRYAFTERWAATFTAEYYGGGNRGIPKIFSPRVGFAYRF